MLPVLFAVILQMHQKELHFLSERLEWLVAPPLETTRPAVPLLCHPWALVTGSHPQSEGEHTCDLGSVPQVSGPALGGLARKHLSLLLGKRPLWPSCWHSRPTLLLWCCVANAFFVLLFALWKSEHSPVSSLWAPGPQLTPPAWH